MEKKRFTGRESEAFLALAGAAELMKTAVQLEKRLRENGVKMPQRLRCITTQLDRLTDAALASAPPETRDTMGRRLRTLRVGVHCAPVQDREWTPIRVEDLIGVCDILVNHVCELCAVSQGDAHKCELRRFLDKYTAESETPRRRGKNGCPYAGYTDLAMMGVDDRLEEVIDE